MKKKSKLDQASAKVSDVASAVTGVIASGASKSRKRLRNPFKKKPTAQPGRITTETLAEHRERVLAGGRRFKYPLQYARHKLVFNTIIIAVAVLLVLAGVVWWQLYKVQNSSDFMYRITRVVPLPVASVDGQPVLYSDYLMRYRSSIHYKVEKEQVDLKTPDGQRQANQVEVEEMDNAISDAYAVKLANEKGITVSDSELQTFLREQRQSPNGDVSEQTYDAVILDYYGWSPDEYEHAMQSKLLSQKVAYAIDTQASHTVGLVKQAVKSSTDLKAVADQLNKNPATHVTFGSSGMVPKDNQDGGLASAAAALKSSALSDVIMPTTGDGYYIIKQTAINSTQVSYDYIHVSLTAFATQLAALKQAGKVQIYITMPKTDAATS